MNTQLTTHIYARASKANAAGLNPIYVRITIDGKRSEFSTRKFIHPKRWDTKHMKVKGTTEEARSINKYLESLKNKITQTQVMLQYQGIPITIENFMDSLHGKKREREKMLIPIFEDHNKRVHSLIGTDFVQGTYEHYQTTLKHTQDYLQYRYKAKDIASIPSHDVCRLNRWYCAAK